MNENMTDYTVKELFEELKNDDSWEMDCEKRNRIADIWFKHLSAL